MFLKIFACVLIIGVAAAFGLLSGFEWQRDRGKSWGESYMKEYGFDETKKEN